jgi:hypothetical protein
MAEPLAIAGLGECPCYTRDLDTQSRSSGLTEQAKMRGVQYASSQAGLSERGPWRWSLFLPFASLLDDVHQSHRSHAQTAHSAQPRSSTPDRTLASHRQHSGSKQSTTIASCPALRAIRMSSGRPGAGSMADVSDVERQAVRMLITRRANIGTRKPTAAAGSWLYAIGDLMIESLPLKELTPRDPLAALPSTAGFERLPALLLRREHPCQPRGRRAAPK